MGAEENREGQRQAGTGTELTKGVGETRGVGMSLSWHLPVPSLGKGRGGPLAPQEPRLVFQSRHTGIFSVQQISLMAQW